MNIIDPSVRVLHVWFAALGNCTTQGETAWVDDSSLMFVLNPPVALSTVSVSIEPARLAVVFDASESYATSQGASIVRYSWNADGTSGSGIRWSHNFTSAGEHLVTLTVVDSNGQTARGTQTISVTPRETALLTPFPYISGGLILTSVFFLALFLGDDSRPEQCNSRVTGESANEGGYLYSKFYR